MPTLKFEFCGGQHELTLPEGSVYRLVAKDILDGSSYPFFQKDVREVRAVVDLGAHVGEWTIMAAAKWPDATIHAFEPNPQALPLLHRNCEPYSNIVIHEQAVSYQAGCSKLFINNWNSVQATMTMTEKTPNTPDSVVWEAIEVDVVGPETILSLAPDVLKVDIEGMEGAVIRSLGEGVARIGTVYVEYHLDQWRMQIDAALSPTHSLKYHRQTTRDHGELMYVKEQ